MKPYYSEDGITIYHGDCREVLPQLDQVHCCVTSPPYWGLRDYGNERQIGLEPFLSDYLEQMKLVFRNVLVGLHDAGTLWLNMGDCYANDGKWGGETGGKQAYLDDSNRQRVGREKRFTGLKSKDMVGLPWSVAFALREEGWYLRSDIIWHKPNPMPESVRDRPTKSHEYIFLMSKNAVYHYDQQAILEPVNGNAHARGDGVNPKCYNGSQFTVGKTAAPHANVGQGPRKAYKMPDGWDTGPGGHGSFHRNGREKGKIKQNPSFSAAVKDLVEARNKRSVWTVATQPFPEAHFATFPEDLIRPCILAGCPADGIVLDPFSGAGTTLLVAKENGHAAIGIEIEEKYCEIAAKRLAQKVLNFEPAAARSSQ